MVYTIIIFFYYKAILYYGKSNNIKFICSINPSSKMLINGKNDCKLFQVSHNNGMAFNISKHHPSKKDFQFMKLRLITVLIAPTFLETLMNTSCI